MAQQQIEFPASELIFREGDHGDAMYVIGTGRVQVFHDTRSGPVIIANLGPGEFFGEMAIVDPAPRSASVVTLEPTSVIRYEQDDVEALLSERPGVGMRIIQVLARRLRKMDQSFEQAINDLRGY